MAQLRKLFETAGKVALDGQSLGATVFTGHGYDTKTVPAIIFRAVSAEEEPFKSGNFRLKCAIDIKDTASATSTHDDIVDAVTDFVFSDAFKPALEAGGITVWDISAPPALEWKTEGDCWVDTLNIELYCCPRVFAS